MRQSKAEIYLHLVWTTSNREPLVTGDIERDVYRCIESEVRRLGAYVLAIGGMPDHVHLVVKIPTRLSVSTLAHQIKGVSSRFVHDSLPGNEAFRWQEGYGVFSLGRNQRDRVISYVTRQKEHHAKGALWREWEEPDAETNEPS